MSMIAETPVIVSLMKIDAHFKFQPLEDHHSSLRITSKSAIVLSLTTSGAHPGPVTLNAVVGCHHRLCVPTACLNLDSSVEQRTPLLSRAIILALMVTHQLPATDSTIETLIIIALEMKTLVQSLLTVQPILTISH